MSRAEYIGFKLTILACYCFTMSYFYKVGVRATYAWWLTARQSASVISYERPSKSEVEKNDNLPQESIALL